MTASDLSSPCIGIVLAGGLGSRLGTPKATLRLGGEFLLNRIIRSVRGVSPIVFVSVAPEQTVEVPLDPHVRLVPDQKARQGPLEALRSTFSLVPEGGCAFVVGCDMPFISIKLARREVELLDGFDAVIPVVGGRPQFLHAVYAAETVSTLEALLDAGERSVAAFVQELNVRYILPLEWSALANPSAFFNINEADDLRRAEGMASQTLS